jgi:hypothetical protein
MRADPVARSRDEAGAPELPISPGAGRTAGLAELAVQVRQQLG